MASSSWSPSRSMVGTSPMTTLVKEWSNEDKAYVTMLLELVHQNAQPRPVVAKAIHETLTGRFKLEDNDELWIQEVDEMIKIEKIEKAKAKQGRSSDDEFFKVERNDPDEETYENEGSGSKSKRRIRIYRAGDLSTLINEMD